jgi:predicted permease
MPASTPRILGRLLYRFAIPLQVFALTYKAHFTATSWMAAGCVFGVLLLGFSLALLCLKGLLKSLRKIKALRILKIPLKRALMKRSTQGSFILSAMLGHTMFIGMAIVPPLTHPQYLGWIVMFGMIHYLLGSYGVGIFLARHYGQAPSDTGLSKIQHLAKVPILWACVVGYMSQSIPFWDWFDRLLELSLKTGVPLVFLLFGLQLRKLNLGKCLSVAVFPAIIKILVIPTLMSIGLSVMKIPNDAKLALVLMTGMPTNSANLILAEEYRLDPQLAAGSILISTILLPFAIPLWQALFR